MKTYRCGLMIDFLFINEAIRGCRLNKVWPMRGRDWFLVRGLIDKLKSGKQQYNLGLKTKWVVNRRRQRESCLFLME